MHRSGNHSIFPSIKSLSSWILLVAFFQLAGDVSAIPLERRYSAPLARRAWPPTHGQTPPAPYPVQPPPPIITAVNGVPVISGHQSAVVLPPGHRPHGHAPPSSYPVQPPPSIINEVNGIPVVAGSQSGVVFPPGYQHLLPSNQQRTNGYPSRQGQGHTNTPNRDPYVQSGGQSHALRPTRQPTIPNSPRLSTSPSLSSSHRTGHRGSETTSRYSSGRSSTTGRHHTPDAPVIPPRPELFDSPPPPPPSNRLHRPSSNSPALLSPLPLNLLNFPPPGTETRTRSRGQRSS
ncbi:hypothetical protein C8Q75DRAFT_782482 [Abortiporus biennis]|nr:hypothetical protein C8Q75DRAFT_782482 [Abortiporus biennis]